jgi:hypothetical protein
MNEIINCLKSRKNWYEKAINMACGKTEWENSFNFPKINYDHHNVGAIPEWRGAVHELQNTIDMMEHYAKL